MAVKSPLPRVSYICKYIMSNNHVHSEKPEIRGPSGYENWHRAIRGVPLRSATETPLYSDTEIAGDVVKEWGPYKVLNTIAMVHQPCCLPVLILRVDHHAKKGYLPIPSMGKTDISIFHGGSIEDEIASLIGLALGIRLRPSSYTREINFDPLDERPRAEDPSTVPTLAYIGKHSRCIFRVPQRVTIEPCILSDYTNLPATSAVALVRAARLFQSALWLCESNPNDAWLMLVSSIEVAAVEWRMVDDDPDLFSVNSNQNGRRGLNKMAELRSCGTWHQSGFIFLGQRIGLLSLF